MLEPHISHRARAARSLFASAVVLAAVLAGCANTSDPAPITDTHTPTPAQPGQEPTFMQIRLRIGETEATAHLYDNPTARDFASLLPLTLTTL